MYIACIVLIVVAGFVVLAGVRVLRSVPKHWPTVRGEWAGPALQFSPHQYRYRTPDGFERSGETAVKVMLRPLYGGACVVAYDPESPWVSKPAQLRWNGAVLICVGVFAAVAGAVFLGIALG
ncbi:MAG: hypothetical protein ACTH30_15150 [Leucobacter sp.]